MTDQRNDLTALILAKAQEHDATFKAEQRLREAVFRSTTVARRKAVMGDPVRYIQVMHIGHDAGTETDAYLDPSDNPTVTANDYEVEVWYEYADDDTLADSSQAGFDSLMFGSNGIVPMLESYNWLSSDEPGVVSPPVVDVLDVVQVDDDGRKFAHYCLLTVTVT